MKKLLILTIIIASLFISLNTVQAQKSTPESDYQGLIYKGSKACENKNAAITCGNYQLNDILHMVAHFGTFILETMGSIVLLMFIYGGILMIISGTSTITSEGGAKSNINKGKKVISAAIIGMIIILTSYIIIKFVLKSAGLQEEWKGGFIKISRNIQINQKKLNG